MACGESYLFLPSDATVIWKRLSQVERYGLLTKCPSQTLRLSRWGFAVFVAFLATLATLATLARKLHIAFPIVIVVRGPVLSGAAIAARPA